MRIITLYSVILFCLTFTVAVNGQSLYKDAQELATAFSDLKQLGNDPSSSDQTAALKTSAKILAILDHYRQWSQETTPQDTIPIGSILETYRQNPALSPLLNAVNFTLNYSDQVFKQAFIDYQEKIRSGPRRQILEILHSDYALSPAEYLSVSRMLKEYEYPPQPNFAFLESAAEVSNQNVKKGFINEAEIIIGLFNFLLKRSQEEFVVTYLERLLGKNGVEQLGELFPNTSRSFENKGVTYSESFLVRLRDAFYEDLQSLSVTLPSLLTNEKYFNLLDEDPILFNFLHIYSMIGLAQQGVSISEIVPLTFRNLFDRYEDKKKSFNLKLVRQIHTAPEYEALVPTTREILEDILLISRDLRERETQISEQLEELFFNDPLARFSLADIPNISGDYQSLDVVLGRKSGQDYSLDLLPSLLSGKLDETIVKSWTTLESYDKFLRNPLSKTQMQAAGLELTRRLNGAWYQETTIVELFRQWQEDVFDFQDSLLVWEAKIDPAGFHRKEQAAFTAAKNRLVIAIAQSAGDWQDECSQEEKYAFSTLQKILTDRYLPGPPASDTDTMANVRKGWQEIRAVETRLAELNKKLMRKRGEKRQSRESNTVLKYFSELKAEDPVHSMEEKINGLEEKLALLQMQLDELDNRFIQEVDEFKVKYAQLELEAIKNISPLVQVTEVLSHLLYVLRSEEDQEDKWISRKELDELFFSDSFRPAFMGLLNQQLGQAKVTGGFSIKNLAALVRLTVRDLDLLSSDTPAGEPDSLGVFRKAAFASNAINRLLELPLFTDPANPDNALSLIDKYPKLTPIPDLSEQTVDFIYFLNIKDHRHALSNFIRLFTDLTAQAEVRPSAAPEDAVKREKALAFLNQYGDFIADLVDADNSRQVEDLLEGFTDPPGSSRVKRREPLTFNLNAYVGGLIGNETIEGGSLTETDTYPTLAPTMPVGLSFSRLIGKGKNPQSFSVFFSIIDLGSLTTYALDSKVEGDNQLTFKNVLRPGLQLHWNIKKSPFFLGVGGQQGPIYREFNGKQEQLNSFRLFVNFGIDVVIKRLH